MVRGLTADARKSVLTAARQEAGRRGDRRLGTDHLLLGLLHDADSPAARSLGVSLADARAACEALDVAALAAVGVDVAGAGPGAPGAPTASPGRRLPPLTSGARAVLKHAAQEARRAHATRVGTGHLLSGLLTREHPDPAAGLLAALKVDPAVVRGRLGRLPGEETET